MFEKELGFKNPFSIDNAKKAHAKYTVDKQERKPIFNQRSKYTFDQLKEWYVNLESVKILSSFSIIKIKLNIFNLEFGNRLVDSVKVEDLKNYQITRGRQGKAHATIDQELSKVRAMIAKAVNNDMLSYDCLIPFDRTKPTLKKGEDVRDRILSPTEFDALIKHADEHIKNLVSIGYYTGMRKGEIIGLTWNRVNLKTRMIELEPQDTKDKESQNIPICDELYEMLVNMPDKIITLYSITASRLHIILQEV